MAAICLQICSIDHVYKFPIYISPTSQIEELIAAIQNKSGLKVEKLYFNGSSLCHKKTIREEELSEGKTIMAELSYRLEFADLVASFKDYKALSDIPPKVYLEPSLLMACFRENDTLMGQLLLKNELLAEAIIANDVSLLGDVLQNYASGFKSNASAKELADGGRLVEVAKVDAEAQKKIEERIRLDNINDNITNAIEFAPEFFVNVEMIYVSCKINGSTINAFVDTGAQKTLMSKKCAEKLGLLRLMDERFRGMAVGVGTAQILGRIHLAEVRIGNSLVNCSINILDNSDMDFLLGLDMLRRHLVEIDLRKGVLRINGDEIAFLNRKQLKSEKPVSGVLIRPYAEESVKVLEGLGFTQEKAREALEKCSGDLEYAASFLYSNK